MPWTYEEKVPGTPKEDDPTQWEIPPARIIANYFNRPVTMTTTDTGLSIGRNGEKLTVFEDYTYVSVDEKNRNFPERLYRFPMPKSELESNSLVNQYDEWK